MSKIGFILTTAWLLFGCMRGELEGDKGEIFLGYPCGNNCEGFKQGFLIAKGRKLNTVDECDRLEIDKRLGCKSYWHEQEVEKGQPGGYTFLVGNSKEGL